MPLNLNTEAAPSGDFHQKLRFNSVGGVWFLKTETGEEKRFPTGFTAVFDMPELVTGWSRFNGSFLDFVADLSLESPAPMPLLGEGDDKWKRAFKVLIFAKPLGGVVEFTHSARAVSAAFASLYASYEKQAAPGMVPVVVCEGDPMKVGDYYAPKWTISKMVPRPAELSAGAKPAPVAVVADDEEF